MIYSWSGSTACHCFCRVRGTWSTVDKDCDLLPVIVFAGWKGHDQQLIRIYSQSLFSWVDRDISIVDQDCDQQPFIVYAWEGHDLQLTRIVIYMAGCCLCRVRGTWSTVDQDWDQQPFLVYAGWEGHDLQLTRIVINSLSFFMQDERGMIYSWSELWPTAVPCLCRVRGTWSTIEQDCVLWPGVVCAGWEYDVIYSWSRLWCLSLSLFVQDNRVLMRLSSKICTFCPVSSNQKAFF